METAQTCFAVVGDGGGFGGLLVPVLQLQVLVLNPDLRELLTDVNGRLSGIATHRIFLCPVLLVQGACEE